MDGQFSGCHVPKPCATQFRNGDIGDRCESGTGTLSVDARGIGHAMPLSSCDRRPSDED